MSGEQQKTSSEEQVVLVCCDYMEEVSQQVAV